MDQKIVIDRTVEFVKTQLANAEGGHDWWHIYRVWKTSNTIAKNEECNILVVNLAALLHDIADPKFHKGDEDLGPQRAENHLRTLEVEPVTIKHVIEIIRNMSFKNTFDKVSHESIEMDIVRDADRLDAIGAIGVARTFNYGGYKGSEIYNPDIAPLEYKSKDEYKNSNSTTINHFYEKLLKLKDLMQTETGKMLAVQRHTFMEQYLQQFYDEWNGIK